MTDGQGGQHRDQRDSGDGHRQNRVASRSDEHKLPPSGLMNSGDV